MQNTPQISVVIPTLRRPKLLTRALDSVFTQTFQDIEVIVVVDGPDHETVAALRRLADPRLQVVVNPKSLTAAGARNVGVERARGAWIAFLDDDDEWLPNKLERQLAAVVPGTPVLVTCLSQVVTPTAAYVWPTTIYDNTVALDEFIFDRRRAFAGWAFIQTSSYLLPRATYLKWPFRIDTPHDDWDFLLRLSKQAGVRIETVREVLVRVYFEEQRPSLSSSGTWGASLDWLDRARPLFTRRAYSGFCLGVVGPRAANERAYAAFFLLLARAFKYGSPRTMQVLTYFSFWISSPRFRRRLRRSLGPLLGGHAA